MPDLLHPGSGDMERIVRTQIVIRHHREGVGDERTRDWHFDVGAKCREKACKLIVAVPQPSLAHLAIDAPPVETELSDDVRIQRSSKTLASCEHGHAIGEFELDQFGEHHLDIRRGELTAKAMASR